MIFSNPMDLHWQPSHCMGNLEDFRSERIASEKSVFSITYYTSMQFYRIKELNSHLQADDLYSG